MLFPARSRVSGTVRRRRSRSCLGAAAATVALVGTLATSAHAVAATLGTNDPEIGSADETAMGSCANHYNWYKSGGTGYGGYAKVEWTKNPCGYLIQTRVWCWIDISSNFGDWSISGVVKKVDLWDQAGCGALELRGGAYVRFSHDGGSTWTTYKAY